MLKDFNKHSLLQDTGAPRAQNPPWADKILNDNWELILDKLDQQGIDRALMPKHTRSRRGGRVLNKEFGCGHFGCVYATNVPGWVCKVTTDETEAGFAAITRELRGAGEEVPEGIVNYLDVFKLRGIAHKADLVTESGWVDKGWKRPAFILWRELLLEAGWQETSDYLERVWPDFNPDEFETFRDQLINASSAGSGIMGAITGIHKRHPGNPWDRIDNILPEFFEKREELEWYYLEMTEGLDARMKAGVGFPDPPDVTEENREILNDLRSYSRAIGHLRENPYGMLIGEALESYLHKGIVFADLHYHNVGLLRIEDYPKIVIFDPGWMVAMNSQWAQVPIMEV